MTPPAPPETPARPSRSTSLRASFGHAIGGVADAARGERNLRIHLGAALLVAALAWGLGLTPTEWAVLILASAMVIAAELLNRALEAVVDLASPGWHPLARTAKDAAAGAVLVLALGATLVGALIFLPRLLALAEVR